MNILIVDDLLVNRKLLKDFLKPYGYCDMVDNGIDALFMFEEGFSSEPYDLVLLDIMMPNMNGQEVLRKIRDIEKKHGVTEEDAVIIFMITAVDSPQSVLSAFYQGGCNEYILKPVKQADLIKKMESFGLI